MSKLRSALPPRMIARSRMKKDGTKTIWYYYQTPPSTGRKKIPLGKDLNEAKRKWAELERKPVILKNNLSDIWDKFFAWSSNRNISGLSPRTLKDYQSFWKFLKPVFGQVHIDQIMPSHLMLYYDKRSSKIRAKKEIKHLSVVFNWARARGLMTTPNPVSGITRQMKADSRRNIYVKDESFALVRQFSKDYLRDAMDIAFMTGQRPADVFEAQWSDIKDGALVFIQNKTRQIVRVLITGELEKVIKRIKSRGIIGKTIICGDRGQAITYDKFKADFRSARLKAKEYADENGLDFEWFQFKDLRAKAATDAKTHNDAQKLLGHRDSKTTAIYRRDKNEAVMPLDENNLFSLEKKVK